MIRSLRLTAPCLYCNKGLQLIDTPHGPKTIRCWDCGGRGAVCFWCGEPDVHNKDHECASSEGIERNQLW